MAFNYKGYAWQESMRKNLYAAIDFDLEKRGGSSKNSKGNSNGGRKSKNY